MNLYRFSWLFILVLLTNLQVASATSVLGKISVYASPTSSPKVFPLVSGSNLAYQSPAIIKINGGTLLAEKGSILKAFDEGEMIIFQVEKGLIYFRLVPSKAKVVLKTRGGDIASPTVLPASNYIIEGKMSVNDMGTTVEVNEGVLEVQSSSSQGVSKLGAGEKVFLAQADLVKKLEVACPDASELVKLVGENGVVDENELGPEGEVLAGGKPRGAVLVNDELEVVRGEKLNKDEPVEIIGAVIDKDNVIISEEFLAKNPQVNVKATGDRFNECTLLVHNSDDTADEGRLAAAAYAIALFTCAIFCSDGDNESDREASPVQ